MKRAAFFTTMIMALSSVIAHADGWGHERDRGYGYGRGSFSGYQQREYQQGPNVNYGQPAMREVYGPPVQQYRTMPMQPAVYQQRVSYQPVYQAVSYERRPHMSRWREGQVIPVVYRSPQYYVDYRPYRLPPPPAGYGWVRMNGDAVLAAVATGVIASVVYNVFH